MNKLHFVLLMILATAGVTPAAVPTQVSFQGVLTNASGNPVADGSYGVVFRIYATDVTPVALWTEGQTVTTSGGRFTARLGSVTPLTASIFQSSSRYLGLTVGADPEISPRTRFLTVPYAFSVATVDSAAGGQITSGVGIGVASGPYRLHVNSSDSVVSRITGDFDGPSGAIFKAEYLGPTSSDYDAYAVRGLALQNTSSEYGVGGRFEGGYNGVVGVGYSAGVIGTGADANGSCMGVSGSTVSTNIGDAYGVRGTASVTGDANGYGVYGIVTGTTTGVRYAGYFAGNVHVNGTLSKAAGSFKIDHPLDPANKYLYHSFVESPDMMNVYNGNVVLDGAGEATVSLPDYFEVLNRDFRYQLTAIGAPAPNLHVAEKINGGRFRIAGGAPGMEVSWMVTGIRQDAFANAHRIPVEENKGAEERGRYLYPEALGKTAAEGIDSARERAVDQRGDQAED